MAWDFATEPEFEEKLAWMREFVRDEIIPLEGITESLSAEQHRRLLAPLQEQVKKQGLWAAHLPPELGGGGFGQVKLGLMHEILGQTSYGPVVFGNNAPDSGNAELIALGIEATGREDQREKWLEPLLAGEIRSAFSMTERVPAPTPRCSRPGRSATATSGSSTATSGSPRTARWLTSSS